MGDKEFEDVFSDELICRCLNTHWPKKGQERWELGDISNLRTHGKFSNRVIGLVGKYINENYDRNTRKPGKPEFGKRIAEIATDGEISAITEIGAVIAKITDIIK